MYTQKLNETTNGDDITGLTCHLSGLAVTHLLPWLHQDLDLPFRKSVVF